MSRFLAKGSPNKNALVHKSFSALKFSITRLAVSLILLGCSPPVAPPAGIATPTLPATREPVVTLAPTSPRSSSPTRQESNVPLTPTQLKYRLVDQFGTVFYCDPDLYPVARLIGEQEFAQRFAEIEKNDEEFQAILKRKALPSTLSPEQKRIVYTESKMLSAITLESSGDQFRFSLRVVDAQRSGFAIEGLIDQNGSISVTKRAPTGTSCPICLSATTRIDTPDGQVSAQDLQVGMRVWTTDRSGAQREAVILKVVKRPVPSGTSLIRLVLEDGREIVASAGHPTTDRRTLGELAVGDFLDGGRILIVEQVVYNDGATYDLLPSGGTGSYWANGILLKSTIDP
jgi:hypothetical protein